MPLSLSAEEVDVALPEALVVLVALAVPSALVLVPVSSSPSVPLWPAFPSSEHAVLPSANAPSVQNRTNQPLPRLMDIVPYPNPQLRAFCPFGA
jgi:hypothetical protein